MAMPGFVYEGVTGAAGAGNLFAGIKFYILQRVPLRTHWKQSIEANGGKLVHLEKQANFVIADHARKNAPPGSVSWKWIEQSLKTGALEDVKKYPAGPSERQIREVGSAIPPRRGRTPFTSEDDRILMEWVAEAERSGASIKGNEIYKELEKLNPRHTSQSWRDRWVKYVSYRPRPEANGDSDSEGDNAGDSQLPLSINRMYHPSISGAPTQGSLLSAAQDRPFQAATPKQTEGQQDVQTARPCSMRDKQQLLDAYDDIMDLPDDSVIAAWTGWADMYPSHSAQEWYNYFKNKIVPMKKARELKATEHKEAKEMAADGEQSRPSTHPPQLVELSDAGPHTMSANQEPAKRVGIDDSQDSPRSSEDSGSMQDNALAFQADDNDAGSSNVRDLLLDSSSLNKTVFKNDLTLLAESLDLVVDFHPKISGRSIPLFKLWQVVNSSGLGGHNQVTRHNLWPEVAKKIGFNEFQHPGAAGELSMCYEEILAEFEHAREEFANVNQDLTESQEKKQLDAQLLEGSSWEPQHSEEEHNHSGSGNAPIATSVHAKGSAARKRFFSTHSQEDGSGSSKRQRVDQAADQERDVPSAVSSRRSSPFKGLVIRQIQSEVHKGDDYLEVSTTPSQRPKSGAKPQRQRIDPEPETQDFAYPVSEENKDAFNATISLPEVSESDPLSYTTGSNSGDGISDNVSGNAPGDLADEPSVADSDVRKLKEFCEFREHHAALGYPQVIFTKAMEATTMETGNAAVVMEEITKGNGIPENIEGVWTARDDEALDADEESEEFRALLAKHTRERISPRRDFLRMMTE